MSETRAVPLDQLTRANVGEGPYPLPLCPGCIGGRLYPYRVAITVGFVQAYHGADYLEGWVAVCVGNETRNREMAKAFPDCGEDPDVPPCGFSMPMTPHRLPRGGM